MMEDEQAFEILKYVGKGPFNNNPSVDDLASVSGNAFCSSEEDDYLRLTSSSSSSSSSSSFSPSSSHGFCEVNDIRCVAGHIKRSCSAENGYKSEQGNAMLGHDVYDSRSSSSSMICSQSNHNGSSNSSDIGVLSYRGSCVLETEEACPYPFMGTGDPCPYGKLRDQDPMDDIKFRSRDECGIHKSRRKLKKLQVGRSFQLAVDAHDWIKAESLISLADKRRLNDGLCIVIDSIWFLSSHEELYAANRLMEKLVEAGAEDFTRAALRTSFLASCISACYSRTLSLADTINSLAERLKDRLQECSGYVMLKADAAANVKWFAEWALNCISSHLCAERRRGHDVKEYPSVHNSFTEAQMQLKVFKRFLELAGNRLTWKDYTEAFDAACFSLNLFSAAMDSGWSSSIAATAMQGLLGMLVEGGADNVNQCCLEAARFGSTELLRILLQIAQRNGIEVDVELALGFASHYCKIGTMECLVEQCGSVAFLGPLMRAAEQGCLPVVMWFVEKGCDDMELCLALTTAASSGRIEVTDYLVRNIPLHVLQTLSMDILKAACERSSGCLNGIAYLLQSDFLSSAEATYAVADDISRLEDETIPAQLKSFCKNEWSSEAFLRGRKAGEDHYLNVLRAIQYGTSPLHLRELPLQLQVTIAYFPLFKECVASPGVLLSQWLRGQLVEAIMRLDAEKCHSKTELIELGKYELLAILKAKLPSFFVGG